MPDTIETTEQLFSYGTLQLESVQRDTFGRTLTGAKDALPGYTLTLLEIHDEAVIKSSGKTHHPMLVFTGREQDRVEGTVFRLTPEELRNADSYEVADYRRDRVTLASGVSAWVYVDARQSQASN